MQRLRRKILLDVLSFLLKKGDVIQHSFMCGGKSVKTTVVLWQARPKK